MPQKLIQVSNNQSIANGAGTNINPALFDTVANVLTSVAPDIVIPVPKATGGPMAVTTTPLPAGANVNLANASGGAVNADVLFWRFMSIQSVQALTNQQKYVQVSANTAIANGAGTAIDPALTLNNVLQAPDIVIPVPKAVPGAVTRQAFVATAMATGPITIQHGEGAPVNMDVLFLLDHTLARVAAILNGGNNVKWRLFTIPNGTNATFGAIYADNADATRLFTVELSKVSGDGSLQLKTIQIAGATTPAASGTLNFVSGTGDATINWTVLKFEKYVDIQNAVSVVNGGGLTFDPGLVVNGVAVMPDIVIPVPKAAATVPFVATDLTGAVGSVNVSHNNAGAILHDILSLKVFSAFRP